MRVILANMWVLFLLFGISLISCIAFVYFFRSQKKQKDILQSILGQKAILESEKSKIEAHLKISEKERISTQSLLISNEEAFKRNADLLEKFRFLIENTEKFIFELDEKGKFIFTNHALQSKMGYSDLEFQDLTYSDLIHPNDKESLVKYFKENIAKQSLDCFYECLAINRFSEEMQIGLHTSFQYNSDGSLEKLKFIGKDLSELHVKVSSINVLVSALGEMFKNSSNPFIIFEIENKVINVEKTKIRWINKIAANLFGLAENADFNLNEAASTLLLLISSKLEGDKELIWSPKSKPDLKYKVESGRKDNLIVVFLSDFSKDFSDLENAYADKSFFEMIVGECKYDFVVFSADEKYLYVNKNAVKDENVRNWIIGKSDEDYVKKRTQNLKKLISRKAIFDKISATGKAIQFEEFNLDRRNEISYYVRELSPVYNSANDLTYFISSGINFTDKYKRLELQHETLDHWLYLIRKEEILILESNDHSKENSKILELSKSFRQAHNEIYFSPRLNKKIMLHAYASTIHGFSELLVVNSQKWPGLDLNQSLSIEDQNIYLIPKILVFNILSDISKLNVPHRAKSSVFSNLASVQKVSISIVIDLTHLHSLHKKSIEYELIAIKKIWQEEGYPLEESDGFLSLNFALDSIISPDNEKLNNPINLLKQKKLLIGPTLEKPIDWLRDKFTINGADVQVAQSIQAINRSLQQNDFHLVVWWGKQLVELHELDFNVLQEKDCSVLFLYSNADFKPDMSFHPMQVYPRYIPESTEGVLELVWMLSKTDQDFDQKLDQKEKSKQEFVLNFAKVLDITEGDKKFMLNLFKSYLNSLDECMAKFAQHIEKNETEELKFLLHKIQATIKTFEIKSLDKVLKDSIKMTERAKGVNAIEAKEFIQKVNRICKEVAIQIRKFASDEKIDLKN